MSLKVGDIHVKPTRIFRKSTATLEFREEHFCSRKFPETEFNFLIHHLQMVLAWQYRETQNAILCNSAKFSHGGSDSVWSILGDSTRKRRGMPDYCGKKRVTKDLEI